MEHVRALPRHFVNSAEVTRLRRVGHPSRSVLFSVPPLISPCLPSPLLIVSCRWYLPARPITDPALHTQRGANDLKEEEKMEEEKEEGEEERAELQLQLSSQVGMRAGEDKAG